LVFLAILAIRPRLCSVHIQSLNHNPALSGIPSQVIFQTASKPAPSELLLKPQAKKPKKQAKSAKD